MQLRMGLIDKRPDWTFDRFRTHWRDVHGPLAARLPGLREYVQNPVVDSAQRGIAFRRGPESLDGFSQLAFDDDAAMRDAIAGEVGPLLAADEARFLSRVRVVTVQRHTVIEPPAPGRALKRMSLLRRREGVSPEAFAREWQAVHGPLVRGMPGVLGYRQNLVTARQSPKGRDVGWDEWPLDGIVELWFADTASIDAAFGSPHGRETMAHAQTFIGEITTFLVEPHQVV